MAKPKPPKVPKPRALEAMERRQKCRAAVILKLRGHSFVEIGALLEVSDKTAKRYYEAGLKEVTPELINATWAGVYDFHMDIVEKAIKAGEFRAATYALKGLRELVGLDRLSEVRGSDRAWEETRKILGLD